VDAGGMRALTIPPRRRVRKWDVSGQPRGGELAQIDGSVPQIGV